jgi:hypothetical protein
MGVTFYWTTEDLVNGNFFVLSNVTDVFEKKIIIILNKCWPEPQLVAGKKNFSAEKIEMILKHPVIGKIPCYRDVLQADQCITGS